MFKVVAIVSIIILLIIGYFIYAIVKRQKEVMVWQQARIKAEIETLENERKRISSDLHDELGPLLSAVRFQINHLEPTDKTEINLLEKSTSQIDEIIQRFREISYDLLPNTLVRKGLVKAVEEFITKLKGAHPVEINFVSNDLNLTKDKEINLYRIIQEIIHNCIKHAQATTLHLSIQTDAQKLILNTTDNGIGFNYEEKMKTANGLGLLNLQSRTDVLNGKLLVSSQPNKGTNFTLTIPY
jgi:two-component system, NarL family, sensor kinase